MKNNGNELLKDDALWAIIFGALSWLVFSITLKLKRY
tara:strand:- start:760 stop:870 length:111 start_codon:yes stop_codon:yes gene_type:complete